MRRIAGVIEAAASPAGVLRIEFGRQDADEAAIRATVRKIGVRMIDSQKAWTFAEPIEAECRPAGKEHEHAHGGLFGERTQLVFAALCGGLLLIGWLPSALTDITPSVSWSLYLTAYLFGKRLELPPVRRRSESTNESQHSAESLAQSWYGRLPRSRDRSWTAARFGCRSTHEGSTLLVAFNALRLLAYPAKPGGTV